MIKLILILFSTLFEKIKTLMMKDTIRSRRIIESKILYYK